MSRPILELDCMPNYTFCQNEEFCDTFITMPQEKGYLVLKGTITKLPKYGVLCGNITEFGVARITWALQGSGDRLPPQTK